MAWGISAGPGRAARRVLLALVAVILAGYLLFADADRRGPRPGELATGPVGATTASSPATAPATAPKWTPPKFTNRQAERDAMVRVISGHGCRDKRVLAAMAAVPRHEFVRMGRSPRAYADTPLPIGYGQTISQPYIVAEMTRLLRLKPSSRVLEIGTGSGYQAAVLTHFTPHVSSIEIVRPLAKLAGERLKRLGYTVVDVRAGDGYYGWANKAPFDAIIVTCAAGRIPPALIKQLAPGGRMVLPVGRPFTTQSLTLVEKLPDGSIRSRSLMAVAFVPMTGQVQKK